MHISSQTITVSDIPVEVIRKNIKHIYFGVRPPGGDVRVSVPRHISNDEVRLAIESRLPWIQKTQQKLRSQPHRPALEYLTGEYHFFQGRRYPLQVVECPGRHTVKLDNSKTLVLSVLPGTSSDIRAQALNNWYRQQLKLMIPALLVKWQPIVGKSVDSWGVKRMKTRWGTCNILKRRIWINLELAKRPLECLEYVVVHELVHLHERYHNEKFKRLMDQFLPPWRHLKEILNSTPD